MSPLTSTDRPAATVVTVADYKAGMAESWDQLRMTLQGLAKQDFRQPVEMRFRDLDALGHVNNAVFLTYLESARLAWWTRVSRRADLARLGMILARTEIDYRSPAVFGDRLVVGVRCASLKRSSFVLELRIEERRSGRLV